MNDEEAKQLAAQKQALEVGYKQALIERTGEEGKQRRERCISSAILFLSSSGGNSVLASRNDVLELAKKFEQFITGTKEGE